MFGGALNTSLKLPIILPRSEAVFPRLSTNFSGFYKIGYLKVSQNSQENTCAKASF